jgi:hypothetical protein
MILRWSFWLFPSIEIKEARPMEQNLNIAGVVIKDTISHNPTGYQYWLFESRQLLNSGNK